MIFFLLSLWLTISLHGENSEAYPQPVGPTFPITLEAFDAQSGAVIAGFSTFLITSRASLQMGNGNES